VVGKVPTTTVYSAEVEVIEENMVAPQCSYESLGGRWRYSRNGALEVGAHRRG
jgi:hypothetical protein